MAHGIELLLSFRWSLTLCHLVSPTCGNQVGFETISFVHQSQISPESMQNDFLEIVGQHLGSINNNCCVLLIIWLRIADCRKHGMADSAGRLPRTAEGLKASSDAVIFLFGASVTRAL